MHMLTAVVFHQFWMPYTGIPVVIASPEKLLLKRLHFLESFCSDYTFYPGIAGNENKSNWNHLGVRNVVLALKEPQSPPCTQIPDENTQKTGPGQLRSDSARGRDFRQVRQQDLRQHSPSAWMSKFRKSPTEGKMFHIHKSWHTQTAVLLCFQRL